MNKIFEIQEKLKKIIIEYDKVIKNNVYIELDYNKELHNLIQQNMVYEGQASIFELALANKDKDIEEVRTLVSEAQERLVKTLGSYVNKIMNFNRIAENNEKYSLEQIEALEEDYFNVVNTYHPAVTLTDDEKLRKGFGLLRNLYIENDVDTYYELKKQLEFVTYECKDEEKEFERISAILADYEQEKARIEKYNDDFKELEEIIADDMLMAKQESAIRERIYVAKNKLKGLAEECNSTFGGEIDFKYNI